MDTVSNSDSTRKRTNQNNENDTDSSKSTPMINQQYAFASPYFSSSPSPTTCAINIPESSSASPPFNLGQTPYGHIDQVSRSPISSSSQAFSSYSNSANNPIESNSTNSAIDLTYNTVADTSSSAEPGMTDFSLISDKSKIFEPENSFLGLVGLGLRKQPSHVTGRKLLSNKKNDDLINENPFFTTARSVSERITSRNGLIYRAKMMFKGMIFTVKRNTRVQWLILCLLLLVVIINQLFGTSNSGKNTSFNFYGSGSGSGLLVPLSYAEKTSNNDDQSFKSSNGQDQEEKQKKIVIEPPKPRPKYVLNNALTVSVVKDPYIYPDLTKLEEYRKNRNIELGDGTKVKSKTHSIIYQPHNHISESLRYSRFPPFRLLSYLLFGSAKKQRQKERQQYLESTYSSLRSSITSSSSSLALSGGLNPAWTSDYRLDNPRLDRAIKTSKDPFEQKHIDPPLVLVVGLDAERYPRRYLEMILQDRASYAKRYGYGIYVRYLQDFAEEKETTKKNHKPNAHKLSPLEFAKIGIMREAMYSFPKTAWFWWLDQDAIITNHAFDIGSELVFDKTKLDKHIMRDMPIIPPESLIHTYSQVSAEQIRLIMLQDDLGMNAASFLIRNDPLYGQLLMDYLRDPLHRNYPGFRSTGNGKALNAAITHMVQWHPAILSRMAVVSGHILGAYPDEFKILRPPGQSFHNGDFVYLLKSSLLSHRGVQDVDFIMDEFSIILSQVSGRPIVPPKKTAPNQQRTRFQQN